MPAPAKPTDARIRSAKLYFLPIKTRVPLKFGTEVTTEVTCARVALTLRNAKGKTAIGWGETPLSVQWVWPSRLSYQARLDVLMGLCLDLTSAWGGFDDPGHPIEVGHAFTAEILPTILKRLNEGRTDGQEAVPWLAALVCNSAFDIALHDAYGVLNERPIYEMYGREHMNADLGEYLIPAEGAHASFEGKYPTDFLIKKPSTKIRAWHLIGGKDPVDPSELVGDEPDDDYPILLRDWIKRDGLTCLKVKLRGDDHDWDYRRLVQVGKLAIEEDVQWLTTDFNCTVQDPDYVNTILDQLVIDHPRIYGMILYVEQPFPYELEDHPIDVHSVSSRKPLFMDESAHDWKMIRLGRSLGWSGVALKTCKTQTGALLSLCWAKAHGMTLMVQDLTNPMLAQIPHVKLGAHAGTIMGVESNGMQFYPEASKPEAAIHPGLYRRQKGELDVSTIQGPGFGYRVGEIARTLPEPARVVG